MGRKLFAAAVSVALAVPFAVLPSLGAFAAESDAVVPPAALVGCDTYRPGGGWDKRDAISDGTTGTNDDIPVRPKHLRLGEPCVQQNPGGPDFYIPMLVSDVPVPMIDADEDGFDDPPSLSDSLCSVVRPEYCVDVLEVLTVTAGANQGFMICAYVEGQGSTVVAPGYEDYQGRIRSQFDLGGVVGPTLWTVIDPGAVSWQRSCEAVSGSSHYVWLGANSHETLGIFEGLVEEFILPGQSEWELGQGLEEIPGFFGGTQPAHFSVGPRLVADPPPSSKMFCRTDFSNAATGVELPIEFAMDWPSFFGNTPVLDVEGNVTDWAFRAEVLLMLPAVEDCTYLEAVELHVCAAVGIGFGVWACSVHVWTVDRWMSNRPYSGDAPEVQLCDQYPTRPECVPILFPPFIDPIDFGVVCADPPAAAWESWDWLGPFFAHYAECLFVPQGGFDRHGQIAASWNASAGGALASSAQAVLDAFYFEGSCGPLFASVDIGGAPMTINTCSWSWAGGLKIALYWIVLVLGMWRALSFAISVVQSAIGATPAPSPIGSDD